MISPTPWVLIRKHMVAHWLRTGLTVVAMTVAIFLLCFLVSIVATLDRVVRESSGQRLVVQSAVSLFVDLPRDYQAKIDSVPGVESVTKFQWFGGYFREPRNFFAQFAVDHNFVFDMYARDFQVIEVAGSPKPLDPEQSPQRAREAMAADRRAAIIGEGLVRDFGWSVGDTVPVTGTIFQKRDNSAWEFNIVGIYRPLKGNFDDRSMLFRYDYLAEMLDSGQATGPRGVGTYAVNIAEGASAARAIDGIDALFANGPQATRTTSEAAFQAGFVSMLGNLPMFVGTIGGAVVFAVFFSVVNTMLMAGRQRFHESGILKALGFSSSALARVIVAESLLLALLGGLGGIALALGSENGVRAAIGVFLPSYMVLPETIMLSAGVSLAIGLVAGLAPAMTVARLEATEALRSEG
ncbi:MAG: ABC transporter permease [Acidobacteriota bacterium]|nr:MAG: ABC transporter permease [Acidobacteriota bacterium]